MMLRSARSARLGQAPALRPPGAARATPQQPGRLRRGVVVRAAQQVQQAQPAQAQAPPQRAQPQQQQQQQRAQPQQQQRAQQQQQQQQAQQQARPPPRPHLVRIAGRTSNVAQAAGAIVKRLRTEDLVRVAAIDEGSILRAVITLTAANNMLQANSGHMLVFQPTAISAVAAEPPRVPEGSLVFYTAQLMQGEIVTLNTLRVTATTPVKQLGQAIASRAVTEGHTLLECFGTAAVVTAVQAVAQARRTLLAPKRQQDLAVVITSTPREPGAGSSGSSESAAGGAPAESSQGEQAGSDAAAAQQRRPPLCHRLVVLECRPRNPRALLVQATVGVSDRMQRAWPQQQQRQQQQQAAAAGAPPTTAASA